MALGDLQALLSMINALGREDAIMYFMKSQKWNQKRMVEALRACGIPTKEKGNRVYFDKQNAFSFPGVREVAEIFFSEWHFDFVDF